jgi:CrcB protein
MAWLAAAAGGAIGSAARHGVMVLTSRLFGSPTPWATAAVNIAGCFIIGWLGATVATGGWRPSNDVRVLVFVGVLGGFTTFSSLGLDTLNLVQGGRIGVAAANVLLQVVLGLGAAFAGFAAGR